MKPQMYMQISILFALSRVQGVQVPPEPCHYYTPKDTTIVTMCSKGIAVENSIDGNISNDKVLLRIINGMENCVCIVSLENQTKDENIVFRKENNKAAAFPTVANCGLKINVDYIPYLNKPIDPIECTQSITQQIVPIPANSKLRLKSEIIDGAFNQGYCVEIIRSYLQSEENIPRLTISCSEHAEEETETSMATQPSNPPQSTEHQSSEVSSSIIYPFTANMSTNGRHTSIITTFIPTDTETMVYKDVNKSETQEGPVLYIAIGLGSVAFIIVLFVIAIVFAKREKSNYLLRDKDKTKHSKSSYQNVETEPDDELQDNILYVPAEAYAEGNTTNIESDIVTPMDIALDVEGNYNTISFEETTKSSDNNKKDLNKTPDTTHSKAGSLPDASVDKNTETRDEKQQPEEPEETTNVYAVVNKTNTNSTLKENNASSGTSLTGKTKHPLSCENNRSLDKSKSDDVHANPRKIIYHPGVEGDYSSIDFDGEKSDNDVKNNVKNNGNDIMSAIDNQTLKEGDDIERHREQKADNDVLLNQRTVVDLEEPSERNSDPDHVYSVVNKPFKIEQ